MSPPEQGRFGPVVRAGSAPGSQRARLPAAPPALGTEAWSGARPEPEGTVGSGHFTAPSMKSLQSSGRADRRVPHTPCRSSPARSTGGNEALRASMRFLTTWLTSAIEAPARRRRRCAPGRCACPDLARSSRSPRGPGHVVRVENVGVDTAGGTTCRLRLAGQIRTLGEASSARSTAATGSARNGSVRSSAGCQPISRGEDLSSRITQLSHSSSFDSVERLSMRSTRQAPDSGHCVG